MLKNSKAFSGYSVDDMTIAMSFYGETLGLDVSEDNGLMTLHLGSGTKVLVYVKPNHAPATYTVLNFPVKSVDQTVTALKERGVRFESYSMPGLETDSNDVCRDAGGPVIAWFRDPAGNIISVLEER
ncbi:VOC family protein [Variovorax humicola]|uniref:VOC family protein n=1 Tax=Variovorax humicola TaxID=1769758 RepID=A0ABU8VSJ9_9BURK